MLHSRRLIQLRLCRLRLFYVRSFSNDAAGKSERVTVPCKNDGFIALEYAQLPPCPEAPWSLAPNLQRLTFIPIASVYRPSPSMASSEEHDALNNSILLYLPRGPILQPQASNGSAQQAETLTASDSSIAAALANVSSATVVQVNYRASRDFRFPTPIHDVLVGYDWAMRYIASRDTESSTNADQIRSLEQSSLNCHDAHAQRQKPSFQYRVGVCGELLGGTLALSLALSECRLALPGESGNTGRVVAAAVNNPILNWIFEGIKTTATKRKSRHIKQQSAASRESETSAQDPDASIERIQNNPLKTPTLSAARKTLFHPNRPADLFDPFASPMLFLRTPGIEVSTAKTALDAAKEPQKLSAEPDATADLSSPSYAELAADDTIDLPMTSTPRENATNTPPSTPSSQKPYRPRKLPLKYPPTAILPAAFPSIRISVTPGSELAEQGREMVSLLRRALGRFEFPGAKGSGVKDEWEERAAGEAETDWDQNAHEAYLRERVALEVREEEEGESRVGWGLEEVEQVGRWFKEEFERERKT